METKSITLKSVKLPRHFRTFQATVNPKKIREIQLKIDAYNRDADRTIVPINGRIQEMALKSNLTLRESVPRFEATFTLNKPPINLTEIVEDLESLCKASNLNNLHISIHSVTFDIGGDSYFFENHRQSKALNLKAVNGKPLGKITEVERDVLLSGNLKFAAPSTCTKIYKEEWKCV